MRRPDRRKSRAAPRFRRAPRGWRMRPVSIPRASPAAAPTAALSKATYRRLWWRGDRRFPALAPRSCRSERSRKFHPRCILESPPQILGPAPPQVHLEADCRLDALEAMRDKLNEATRAENGPRISLVDCAVRAFALALQREPRANIAHAGDGLCPGAGQQCRCGFSRGRRPFGAGAAHGGDAFAGGNCNSAR